MTETGVIPVGGNADTPSPSGGEGSDMTGDHVLYFTGSKANGDTDYFTYSGNLASGKGTATVNGTTYDICLKMESKTSLTFDSKDGATLFMAFASGNTGKKVKVDKTEYTTDSKGTVKVTGLSAGTHTITKADGIFLYYVSVSDAPSDEAYVTLSFDYNYDDAPDDRQVSVPAGKEFADMAAVCPAGFARSGYTLEGFYTGSGCDETEKIKFPYTAEKNALLYAKWEKNEENSSKGDDSSSAPSGDSGKGDDSSSAPSGDSGKGDDSSSAPSGDSGKGDDSSSAPSGDSGKGDDSSSAPSGDSGKSDDSGSAPSGDDGKGGSTEESAEIPAPVDNAKAPVMDQATVTVGDDEFVIAYPSVMTYTGSGITFSSDQIALKASKSGGDMNGKIQISKVRYKNNRNAGQADVYIFYKLARGVKDKAMKKEVRSRNREAKVKPLHFTIAPRDISVMDVKGSAVYKASGGKWSFRLAGTIGSKPVKLIYNKDEDKTDFVPAADFDPASGKVVITGKNNFTGTVTVDVTSK